MSKKRISIFLLLPLLLSLLFLLVGCGNTYMGLAARWIANGQQETDFYEKTTYSAKPYTTENKDKLKFALTSGTVEQIVQGQRNKDIFNPVINSAILAYNAYTLTTTVNLTGAYTWNGQTYSIDGTGITSTVHFTIGSEGLRPIRSEQQIRSVTPNKIGNSYTFDMYDYSVTKYYNADASAVQIRIAPNGNSTTVQESIKMLDNLRKNNTPYDNAQLYFIARAMQDKLNTVNTVTESAVVPTTLNLITGKEKLTLPISTEEREYDTTSIAISIAGNGIGKGPGRTLKLLSHDDYKHFIYSITETMPYNLGAMHFTLTAITKTNTTQPNP